MTFVSKIGPAELERRETERRFRNRNEAFAVMQAATVLNDALERSGGQYSTAASHALLHLCNAMLVLADDDVEAMRDNTAFELDCDKQGNPIREVEQSTEWGDWSDADKMRVFGGYR